MEKWSKPSRDQRKYHQRENPSFSSTLLDTIYRSIDEGNQTEEKEIFYRETNMRKQKQFREESVVEIEAEKQHFRRARKVENWIGKKGGEKVSMGGRNSLTEFERRTLSMHSSSSSSESSSASGFSSSESESFYGIQRPKPIRTSVSEKSSNFDSLPHIYKNKNSVHIQSQIPKNENFGKIKSKTLRILYGDLKKSKQPISPGAKLASFLNSLFTSNSKKPKGPTITTTTTTSAQASTCSSVSSFSRSCLSKTPSSRSGAKRSVRFCPVSVIVDEDCRPCGHKNLHGSEEILVENSAMQKSYVGKSSSEELRLHVMQESRRVEELARDLLKNYQKKNGVDFNMQFEDEDDDDDVESCSSSDLFELDNLSAIGIEKYREELPVYETTHFNPNRVISNGFIM